MVATVSRAPSTVKNLSAGNMEARVSVMSCGQWMTVSCYFYETSRLMLAPALRYAMYALG